MSVTKEIVADDIYMFPWGHLDETGEGPPEEMCKLQAQVYLSAPSTPMPTSEATKGPRPHAYRDGEGLLAHLRCGLPTLNGIVPPPSGKDIVYWMYVAGPFDYQQQTQNGQSPQESLPPPGGWRIVTDRSKNFVTMLVHNADPRARGRFERVPVRRGLVEVTRRDGMIVETRILPPEYD
ncbi:hypothetical protein ASPVEDRAFT_89431 [Aspergillus versicolor CBS 583.65]|uniref:Uncharacterized protein n=1 Tax=Aspergillus versicolor CBS 583.65 TaxID=1036611 RepID=A0A1L9Q3B6_ASPVE|nr:uncharacterized protein ASPVEDRAFT_89431 [Aspergillus versicolor CBS 583.65]OJJ08202.1 hypothetical protein ASPVEDRAFT_89431 [Aspergillus versicolor CBS 583.65]